LGRSTENFDYAVFLALNITAFFMFRNIITKSIGAFSANRSLFVYKQIKPIDTIVARVLVEIFITSIIISVFVLIGFYFNFDLNIKNLIMVTLGFLFLIFFSISIGLFLAILNTFLSSTTKIVNIILRISMFVSAVFYTVEMVPVEIRNFLLYNPLVHFMELIHGNYFYALDDHYVNYIYILLWTLTPLYIGLWFYKKLEEKIISR